MTWGNHALWCKARRAGVIDANQCDCRSWREEQARAPAVRGIYARTTRLKLLVMDQLSKLQTAAMGAIEAGHVDELRGPTAQLRELVEEFALSLDVSPTAIQGELPFINSAAAGGKDGR